MKLNHVANKTLLVDVKNLVRVERESTLQILFHLKEIDRRKLFSDLKYPSLFSYCVKELGYSESAAQRRIVAARLIGKMPQIVPKIEKGSLSLSNISAVINATKNPEEQKFFLQEVEGLSRRECDHKIFELTGKEKEVKETKERVAADKMKVAIVLKDETIMLIDHLKAMLGENDMDEILKFAMTAGIEKVEKEKFKQTKGRNSPPPADVKRYVSVAVKREVYLRDKKCTHCGGTYRLEFDHRKPFALGGLSSIENIRLLCFHCNQRARIRAGLVNPKGSRKRDHYETSVTKGSPSG